MSNNNLVKYQNMTLQELCKYTHDLGQLSDIDFYDLIKDWTFVKLMAFHHLMWYHPRHRTLDISKKAGIVYGLAQAKR